MNFLPYSKNQHSQAILALILANIIWGIGSPIFKLALQNIPPFTLAFFRFFGAMLILFPFTVSNLWIKKEDWFKLIVLSFFGITVNITFFFLGLKYAPSINAPIIASAGPVFLYLFSIFYLHEKNHPKVLIGTIISLIGVFVIIGQPILKEGLDGQVLGNLFFLLSALGAVIHAVMMKQINSKYPASVLTFWSFLIGSLTFLPFFILEMTTLHPFNTIDNRGWLGLVFGILLSSLAAYWLFDWGLKKIAAQEVGLFYYIDPIAAAVIAIPLLGETISLLFVTGSILVFGGIFIAEGRLHYHPLHKLSR
ncbi:DMT family transporter [Candidatus Gottesmanbacteria bacterium]|nr:DMT family transporter [Candidatus Gottesmanbacteria bacterium]